MLLQEEQYVVKWLTQYGALSKTQIIRMLQKPRSTAEKILRNLRRQMQISDISGGYYIGTDPMCKPDQRTMIAVWVLLKFIDQVDPMAHYPASYPSQLFFLKENMGYEIVVLYEGEGSLLRLLQPDEDLKYTFRGWATTPMATTADYQPGGSYTANAAVTLYAVWEKDSYTVSYDANGGTCAPASQVKKYGETLKLRTEIPTRSGYDFLGWAESSTATSATYLAGANYSENAGITLYAVWRERNYDFSVSNLTVTPDEVWQYDKITVNFRVDNWDRYNAYSDVPVSVWLNGVCVYTGIVDFHAYGVNYITFDLNVGALEGKQTLEARINWDDRASETRSNNNAVQAQFEVKKYSELSTSAVTPSADYIEGNDIIASFYVSNDSSTPVLPSDHMSYRLEVYLVDGATETLVSTQDKTDVVIPANGTNLVYFKWRVPENSAGKLYMFRGIANAGNTVRERNPDNNATFFMKTVKAKETSQTPNTRYERKAPNTYNPLVSSPATTVGSASWNEWVYENGKFELRTYGVYK